MEKFDFSKRKSELDAEYKRLDALRQQHVAAANEIWSEQIKLQGKHKMLEELEIQSKEAEKAVEKPLGVKKNKKK